MATETPWREMVGRGVLDPNGPDGEPITTPTDRRWLWHLEGWLAVNGTNPGQHAMRLALYRYLCETCEHHWLDYEGGDLIQAHRQCLWCNDVEWEAS